MHLIRKKLALVIVLPIAFALGTAGVSYGLLANEYTANVSMYVLSRQDTSTENLTSSDLTASQMLANDFAQIAKSDRVLSATASALGMSSLDGYEIDITSSTTTRVITLNVTGKNAAASMTIANQMANEIADTAVGIMNLQSVNIIDSAAEPTSPSGPPRSLYTLVALVAGLFVAIALVVLLDLLNTTVKSVEDAEETLGLPVLGRIPTMKGLR